MKYGAYEEAKQYTKELCLLSDDYTYTYRMLSELYDNVPKELDCMVRVYEFHFFPDSKCKKILEWLNNGESK